MEVAASLSTSMSEGEASYDEGSPHHSEGAEPSTSFRSKILQVVKDSPNHTLRPARLSQELGISVTDASAELCGLLKAVGSGSSFHFETMEGGIHTMVFSFPPNFESKAKASQRKDEWREFLANAMDVTVKVLKMLTAFGLILSTLIVSIAAIVALVAAIAALSRSGDNRTTHNLTRKIQELFITIRQLLWLYAVFGSDEDGDPFFREAAYDTSLVLSLCCGNPSSMWFWLRASHLRRRRRRMAQGWGQLSALRDNDGEAPDLEGVRLIRRGEWDEEETVPVPTASETDSRGLLSIAVEFLFGPTSSPGPCEADKWKLRGAVIINNSQESPTSSIRLKELSPFVDSPPRSLQDKSRLVSECLLIVAHFNGAPSSKSEVDGALHESDRKFVFPELLAESTVGYRYTDPSSIHTSFSESVSRWKSFFYQSDSTVRSTRAASSSQQPTFLTEQPMAFTKLTAKEFLHCLILAILNLFGVIWFAQSLEPSGVLEQALNPGIVKALQSTLIPVLLFYAKLFFVIPTIRMIYVMIGNELCRSRNMRRLYLSVEVSRESESPKQESGEIQLS